MTYAHAFRLAKEIPSKLFPYQDPVPRHQRVAGGLVAFGDRRGVIQSILEFLEERFDGRTQKVARPARIFSQFRVGFAQLKNANSVAGWQCESVGCKDLGNIHIDHQQQNIDVTTNLWREHGVGQCIIDDGLEACEQAAHRSDSLMNAVCLHQGTAGHGHTFCGGPRGDAIDTRDDRRWQIGSL